MRRLVCLALLAAPAWAGYGYQSVLTLGNSGQIPASQSNFTVVVCANMALANGSTCQTISGLKGTGSGGYVTSSSGYDIVFSATTCSSPTLMSWEMPTYAGSSGAMEAHVKLTTLSSGGTFYMCVGNTATTTFQGGSAGAAWDSSVALVMHFADSSFSSSATIKDWSSNGNSGTVSSAASYSSATGQLGQGLNLGTAGTINSEIDLGTASQISMSAGSTLQFWMQGQSSYSGNGAMGGGYYSGDSSYHYWALFDATNIYVSYPGGYQFLAHGTITSGTWYLWTVTVDASKNVRFYKNGASLGSSPGQIASFPMVLGRLGAIGGGSYGFGGMVDEIEVCTTARPDNWITTQYNNQSNPAAFLTVGTLSALSAPAFAPALPVIIWEGQL